MASSKIADIRSLSDEEIMEQIFSVKKELLDLRVQRKLGKLEKPHRFRELKRNLARLMTVRTEKESSSNTSN